MMLNRKNQSYLLLVVLWMLPALLIASTPQIQAVKSSSSKVSGVNVKLTIHAGVERSNLSPQRYLEKVKRKALGNYTVLNKKVKTFQNTQLNYAYTSRKVKYKRSSNMVSILNACQSSDGRLYVIDAVIRAKDVLNPVVAHILKETLKTCQENTAYKLVSQHEANASSKKKSHQKTKRASISIATKPNKGVKPRAIKAIIYEFDSYLGGGGLLQLDHDIYVLFKDGWSYRNPTVPVSDLDMSLSKKHEPKKWQKWRKQGKNYEIERIRKNKRKWQKIVNPKILKAQKKGKKYKGAYRYTQASGSVWYGANVSRGAIEFKPDRRYEDWSSSQYGSGIGNSDVVSIAAHQYCDKSGGKTTVSANSAGAYIGSGGNKTDCADDKIGSYFVEGFTIEQKNRTGLVTRLPFYELSEKSIMIGGQVYRKKE